MSRKMVMIYSIDEMILVEIKVVAEVAAEIVVLKAVVVNQPELIRMIRPILQDYRLCYLHFP